jgi:hypothetical protein
MTDFQNNLSILKNQGLSSKEIRDFLKERSLTPETAQQIELLASIGKFQTNEDILHFMKNNPNAFNMSGANWNGEVLFMVGWTAGVILVITAIVLILKDQSKNYICTEYSTNLSCSMDQWCMTYDDWNNCVSWSSETEFCSYPCVNGYWEN